MTTILTKIPQSLCSVCVLAVPPALSSSPDPREFLWRPQWQQWGDVPPGGAGSPLAPAGTMLELRALWGLGLCQDLPCAGLGAGVGGLV